MADAFVRVRLLQITGADLNIFDFDHDLTWAAFFMNADGLIYGRFGGRDAKGADTRNTLPGLRFALESALESHRLHGREKPARAAPVYVEKYASVRKVVKNGCIHCHQVKEIRRQEERDAGTWKRESIWVYPLPENVGIVLDPDQGKLVRSVLADSPAQRAGVAARDVIRTVNDRTIFSFADFQYALHYSPIKGEVDIAWTSDGRARNGKLQLAKGWRKTNLSWRPSLLDLLPSLPVFGYDLSAKEKAALGLDEQQLAFRQASPVHSEAQAIGVREGDIIVGIDNLKLQMNAAQFLSHVRENYLVGDRVVLNVVRDGKKVDLPTKLR